ncbi:predicted protein [Plenodomus lingam JN3]|uniref:Predicted protein n=1 Tax=Leptosphaeria maculans (strain JN3 / isolate v23.1.3 / race Av1-4-5-6-7-8) TaxID=985895 RepID=E4ZPK7_LEPMJ|nr:predicted protein [Plenodomus lingam JN3]CBX93232.1 predicted protein [Plenodomus lingam JN3]
MLFPPFLNLPIPGFSFLFLLLLSFVLSSLRPCTQIPVPVPKWGKHSRSHLPTNQPTSMPSDQASCQTSACY